MVERIPANEDNAFRQIHTAEGFTSVERIPSNLSQRVREAQFGQSRAILECIVINGHQLGTRLQSDPLQFAQAFQAPGLQPLQAVALLKGDLTQFGRAGERPGSDRFQLTTRFEGHRQQILTARKNLLAHGMHRFRHCEVRNATVCKCTVADPGECTLGFNDDRGQRVVIEEGIPANTIHCFGNTECAAQRCAVFKSILANGNQRGRQAQCVQAVAPGECIAANFLKAIIQFDIRQIRCTGKSVGYDLHNCAGHCIASASARRENIQSSSVRREYDAVFSNVLSIFLRDRHALQIMAATECAITQFRHIFTDGHSFQAAFIKCKHAQFMQALRERHALQLCAVRKCTHVNRKQLAAAFPRNGSQFAAATERRSSYALHRCRDLNRRQLTVCKRTAADHFQIAVLFKHHRR